MTDSNHDERSNAIERLRRGRDIVAPARLWTSIDDAISKDRIVLSWPSRLAALAAGALLWIGVRHTCLEADPRANELPLPVLNRVIAATPFLLNGTIEPAPSESFAARTEVLLVSSLYSSLENPR